MNLLIPYVHLYDHSDPLFEEFTYGDDGARARKLKKSVKKGDYIFFHTTIRGKKCITAYYVVDRVLDVAEAAGDRNIAAKYRNPHIRDFISSKGARQEDDNVIVFGDPITSRVLDRPSLFDKSLVERISLNIGFPKGRTETQSIASATRSWRELTDEDVTILLKAVESSGGETLGMETVLSTDEVTEILERDLEGFIEKNPSLIGESLKLSRRQLDTSVGRIDLLFEDEEGNITVVEMKLDKIGRAAINQLRRYMGWAKEQTRKDVSGVIVCKGIMPAFENEFGRLRNIKILCYGWQLKVYPWENA